MADFTQLVAIWDISESIWVIYINSINNAVKAFIIVLEHWWLKSKKSLTRISKQHALKDSTLESKIYLLKIPLKKL